MDERIRAFLDRPLQNLYTGKTNKRKWVKSQKCRHWKDRQSAKVQKRGKRAKESNKTAGAFIGLSQARNVVSGGTEPSYVEGRI